MLSSTDRTRIAELREAFVAGFDLALTSQPARTAGPEAAAALRYVLVAPRVGTDMAGVAYRVRLPEQPGEESAIEYRRAGWSEWVAFGSASPGNQPVAHPERIALWYDLLTNPLEETTL